MNKPGIPVSKLLERLESEFETADGRKVRICRDPSGRHWVIDGAERVVPFGEFAADFHEQLRPVVARERAAALREIASGLKAAFARLLSRARQTGAKTAHA